MYYIIQAFAKLLSTLIAAATALAILYALLVYAAQVVPVFIAYGIPAPYAGILAFLLTGVVAGTPGAVLIGLIQRYTK